MKRLCSTLCILFVSLTAIYAQKIRFSPQWTSQSQFAGYYAAQENGYYQEAGLDVEIIHPTKSASAVNMLKDDATDIIICEVIQAMMCIENDLNLVNILQTTQHSTLALIAHSKDIDDLSDLTGCRVGTWKIGFSEIPHMIDKKQNLGIEWVKLINPLNIYISGAIDATLAKTYNEFILFEMAGVIPGSVLKFADKGFDFPEDGIYVKEEFFKNNPELCRRFAEASRKGWEWVRANREAALDIVMEYTKADNVTTNRYNQKWMLEAILEVHEDVKGKAPSYHLDQKVFEQMNKILLEYGYISEPVDYNRFTGGKQK